MAKRIGVLCIALGFLCLFSAVGLIVYNHMEEKSAEASSAAMLRDVQQMTEAEGEPIADAEYPAEMLVFSFAEKTFAVTETAASSTMMIAYCHTSGIFCFEMPSSTISLMTNGRRSAQIMPTASIRATPTSLFL